MTNAVVHSSSGDYIITTEGVVVGMPKLGIVEFDIMEYKNHYGQTEDEYDILDLGYWYVKNGETRYEYPVDEFRNMQRDNQEIMGK